jgi:hypothetical protein
MTAYADLDHRWRLLVPGGAVVVAGGRRRDVLRRLRALPAQTTVVLLGGRRLRWLARRAGLRVRAEYLALPSLATPVAITQRQPPALRFTARTLLTVPSGVARPHLPFWLAVRLVQAVPGLLARTTAGERLVLAVRT